MATLGQDVYPSPYPSAYSTGPWAPAAAEKPWYQTLFEVAPTILDMARQTGRASDSISRDEFMVWAASQSRPSPMPYIIMGGIAIATLVMTMKK